MWGPEEEGLVPPTFLSFDTNLLSIKRNNNTNAHYGEMAMWQMRGVMVKEEDEVEISAHEWHNLPPEPPITIDIVF